MDLAPQADPCDGLLEVLRLDPVGRGRLMVLLRRLFDGAHLDSPHVHHQRSASVTIEALDERTTASPLLLKLSPTSTRRFDADCRHWHATAHAACAPYGAELYPRFKAWCDRYFYLPHRGETRGIGGLFFDDFNELPFAEALAFTQNIGNAYLDAYLPIVQQRKATPYGTREREFQRYRRGRYVEFNLLYDRGTHFGLQSGGRTESILMSLPPDVRFEYAYKPAAGSPEAALQDYLRPRNWTGDNA